MKLSTYISMLLGCIVGGIFNYYILRIEETFALEIGMIIMLTFCYIITYKDRSEQK